jgi:hypothetical protein
VPPPPRDPAPLPPHLVGVDLAALRLRVLYFALKRTGNEADAEDVTSRALSVLFDPDYAPPNPGLDLFFHLCDQVRNHLSNDRRKRRRRGDTSLEGDDDDNDDDTHASTAAPAASSRNPDRLLAEKREADLFDRRWSELRTEMAGDDDSLGVMNQTELGVDDPAEQAAALGIPAVRVYNANRRIRRAAEAIAKRITE